MTTKLGQSNATAKKCKYTYTPFNMMCIFLSFFLSFFPLPSLSMNAACVRAVPTSWCHRRRKRSHLSKSVGRRTRRGLCTYCNIVVTSDMQLLSSHMDLKTPTTPPAIHTSTTTEAVDSVWSRAFEHLALEHLSIWQLSI